MSKSPLQKQLFERDISVKPFLKWAGGKRKLLPEIRELIPRDFGCYFEPFVGAGAVLFDLQPRKARINDINEELINCYRIVKEDPEGLIAHVRQHPKTKKHFYELRSLDRDISFRSLSALERASRIIFLNKTCYNGLFRVNSRGQLNVPFASAKRAIVNESVIRAVSRYFNAAQIEMSSMNFQHSVKDAKAGDFVYFDPPYFPRSDTSSFTGYNTLSFGREEQWRLRDVCDDLTTRRCRILLSNSDTEFIRSLYSDKSRYVIVEVKASRNINSVSTARGKITELLVFNKYKRL